MAVVYQKVAQQAIDEAYEVGRRNGIINERARILAIIENEPWEVYGEDYYQTYDAQASIANLKSLIESQP